MAGAGVDEMLREFAIRYGFDKVEAEFDEGWISVLRGRIGTRTLEVRHCKTLPEALDRLIRTWSAGDYADAWPPAWLLPREKSWTDYPWPYGSHRDYYDRSYRDEVA